MICQAFGEKIFKIFIEMYVFKLYDLIKMLKEILKKVKNNDKIILNNNERNGRL